MPIPGTLPGASVLDAPPPNPSTSTAGNNPGFSMAAMAQGASTPAMLGAQALPPEVLQGALKMGEGMVESYDQLAQLLPQFAPQWLQAKNALLDVLANVASLGAPPTSPTAAGSNFPGGGFDKGGMTQATGGL